VPSPRGGECLQTKTLAVSSEGPNLDFSLLLTDKKSAYGLGAGMSFPCYLVCGIRWSPLFHQAQHRARGHTCRIRTGSPMRVFQSRRTGTRLL